MVARENSQPLDSPQNDMRNECKYSIFMTVTSQNWVVLLIHCSASDICFNQSEALPRSSSVMLWISMKFLGLFLRCHFAGKLVVTSQNVGCFLRLFRRVLPEFDSHLELRIFSVFAGDQILFLL